MRANFHLREKKLLTVFKIFIQVKIYASFFRFVFHYYKLLIAICNSNQYNLFFFLQSKFKKFIVILRYFGSGQDQAQRFAIFLQKLSNKKHYLPFFKYL